MPYDGPQKAGPDSLRKMFHYVWKNLTDISNVLADEYAALDGSNQPFTDTVDAPNFGGDYFQFDITYMDGQAEGRLQWNTEDGTLEVGMPGGNVNLQIGQEMLVRVRNISGVTIPNGSVVYASGASANRLTVALANADASTPLLNRVAGIATEEILNNSNGFMTTQGLVRDVNTLGMAEGAPLWLSEITDGAFTTTRPAAPDASIVVGLVIRAHATEGIILADTVFFPATYNASDVETVPPSVDGQFLQYNFANSRYELANISKFLRSDVASVFNEAGADIDFRFEAVGQPNALFIQGSDGRVGVGTGSPQDCLNLEVEGDVALRLTDTTIGKADWRILNNTSTGRLTFSDANGSTVPFKFAPDSVENLLRIGIVDTGTVSVAGNIETEGNVNPGGFLGFGSATLATISGGVFTATGSWMNVATEGAASSDEVDTINGGEDGDVLFLKASNAGDTVILKDGTGNLRLAADFSLTHTDDTFALIKQSNIWRQFGGSDNTA